MAIKTPKLFTSLFGNDKPDELFDRLNNFNTSFFANLSTQKTDDQSAFDVLGAFDTNTAVPENLKEADITGVADLLDGLQISKDRLARYGTYNTIYESLQLVKRILAVYISNIFQRDTVNNTVFTIRGIEGAPHNEVDEHTKFCKQVVEFYKLEEKLRDNMSMKLLKYGDAFIELIDITKLHNLEKHLPKVKSQKLVQKYHEKLAAKSQSMTESIHSSRHLFSSLQNTSFQISW